jgi:hypothetical protein
MNEMDPSADGSALKGDMGKFVASQVAGDTMEQTATVAGISVSTVQRRLADPNIQKLIREQRDKRLVEMLDRQADLARMSSARLATLIEHEAPNVALRAIGLVFTNTVRLTIAVDTATRLADIETRMEGVQ